MNYWNNPNLDYLPPELKGLQEKVYDLIVVDNFLQDPLAARELILNLPFENPPDPKKYGVISSNAAIPSLLEDEIKQKLENVLNKKIKFHPRSKCAMTFAYLPLQSVCHMDGGDGMCMFNWTVVIYLNLPEQCAGGTDFFRHIPTGHISNENGFISYYEDMYHKDKWELLEHVEMRFNRALLAPAWRFHSIAHTFGHDKSSARLTLNPKIIAYD